MAGRVAPKGNALTPLPLCFKLRDSTSSAVDVLSYKELGS